MVLFFLQFALYSYRNFAIIIMHVAKADQLGSYKINHRFV